jgi:carboxyl-terminal processing protease
VLGTLDPHSEFMEASKFDELKKDTEGEFGGVGIVVQLNKEKSLTIVAPMEDTPGYRAGILSGDRIMKIDTTSTEKFSLEDAVKLLRGEPGTDVSLTILRPSTGALKDYKLTRAKIKVDTVKDVNNKKEFPIGDNNIGYIRLTQFGDHTSSDMEKALKKLEGQGMQGLILDLRGNPGGLLEQAGLVCEKFLPKGQLIVSTEGRTANKRDPYYAHGGSRHPNLPMVILVNGGSASAAEIVAGCLQDLQPITHAIVLGEQTFGKGSVQSILPLPDGSALRLTTAKYYTPSHKVIHEKGITPDILVPMTDDDERNLLLKRVPGGLESLDPKERAKVEAARDLQLDRAMDLLKGITLYTKNQKAGTRVAAK